MRKRDQLRQARKATEYVCSASAFLTLNRLRFLLAITRSELDWQKDAARRSEIMNACKPVKAQLKTEADRVRAQICGKHESAELAEMIGW